MHIPSLLLSILGVASIASAFPSRNSKPERQSQKLDANADEDSLRYQPAFYFDKGDCTRRKAFDNNGTENARVPYPAHCVQRSLLSKRNVYTRKRCNNGWCAYMYEYDLAWGSLLYKGRARWENIVVFVKNNTVQHVAASEKGEYIRRDTPYLQEGHPLMLNYASVSQLRNVFRFANKGYVEKIKKDVGEWVIVDLVDWDRSPRPEPKRGGTFHLADEHFTDTLYEAAGECVPGFDCGKVETKDLHKEKQKEEVKAKDKVEVEEKDSEKKFDIKETVKGKDKHEAEEKDQKIESGKEKEEDKKFDIKEDKEDKNDKKENEKDDDKDDKDGKDDKEDDKKEKENQFDIKEQKDNKDDKKDDKKEEEKEEEKEEKKEEKKEEHQFDIRIKTNRFY